jgi:uncharacterized membrane protein YuzA (DUF378 family)
MKVIYWIFLIIVLLSSIDCLLFAGLNMDLIAKYFPDVVTKSVDAAGIETTLTAMSMGAKIVYGVFGLAGVRVVVANLVKKD